jgi:hypothetical protein
MSNSRFMRGGMAIIAILLLANLAVMIATGGNRGIELANVANAQSRSRVEEPRVSSVRSVQGFQVDDLKEVVSLGDGKTFVVSNPKGFMVYTVEKSQQQQ